MRKLIIGLVSSGALLLPAAPALAVTAHPAASVATVHSPAPATESCGSGQAWHPENGPDNWVWASTSSPYNLFFSKLTRSTTFCAVPDGLPSSYFMYQNGTSRCINVNKSAARWQEGNCDIAAAEVGFGPLDSHGGRWIYSTAFGGCMRWGGSNVDTYATCKSGDLSEEMVGTS